MNRNEDKQLINYKQKKGPGANKQKPETANFKNS